LDTTFAGAAFDFAGAAFDFGDAAFGMDSSLERVEG
jgi:hypothetical protein